MTSTKLWRHRRWAGAVVGLVLAVLLASAAVAAKAGGASASGVHTYLGPAVHIGRGTIHTLVVTGADNRPSAIGLVFTPGMLEGLPAKPGRDPELDNYYFARFASNAPFTGFDHVLIDWHPLGHVPKNIYTVPHFDFHFYVIDKKSQMAISYPYPETTNMTGVTMPATALVPAGYFAPPGTQVSEMGLHAVPEAAPEFHGKPFTNTLIYGYWKGRLVFVEPMITMAYLKGLPQYSETMPTPRLYSYTGYYPTQYSVRYDAKKQLYTIMLGGLEHREAPGT